MNQVVSQPPALPCAKCGGNLAEHGAYRFRCESCHATCRRQPDAAEAATLVMMRLGCLGLAFAPIGFMFAGALPPDQLGPFLVLNAGCSLVAGPGMLFRVAGWKTTVFAGLGLSVSLFLTTSVVGVFVGCVRAWP